MGTLIHQFNGGTAVTAFASNDLLFMTDTSDSSNFKPFDPPFIVDANGIEFTDDVEINTFLRLNTSELTISSGSVTPTKSYHTVDTESDAASDDLDTITATNDGDLLIIRAADGARTVSVTESGNIKLSSAPFALDNAEDTLLLMCDGTNWLEISRSDNGS